MRAPQRIAARTLRRAALATLSGLAALLPAAPVALAQSERSACTVAATGARMRSATYVALGKDLLFRLQLERSIDDAVLIVNRVDGNRLYDRAYWRPVKSDERCGQRSVDYVDEAASGGNPAGLRLVLEPAEEVHRAGLPRPMLVFAATAVLPSGATQVLQFEEVVIRREVGAPAPKR
jgi:hypothetical protein